MPAGHFVQTTAPPAAYVPAAHGARPPLTAGQKKPGEQLSQLGAGYGVCVLESVRDAVGVKVSVEVPEGVTLIVKDVLWLTTERVGEAVLVPLADGEEVSVFVGLGEGSATTGS